MDREAWWATAHGVAKSQTQFSEWTTVKIHMSPPSWTSLAPPTLSLRSRLSQSTGFELLASFSKFPHLSILCSASQSYLFDTPRAAAHQTPLSMKFSRQEYWSRLPLMCMFQCYSLSCSILLFIRITVIVFFWLCYVFIAASELSLVATLGLTCSMVCEILVPWPGIEPKSLHWKVDS